MAAGQMPEKQSIKWRPTLKCDKKRPQVCAIDHSTNTVFNYHVLIIDGSCPHSVQVFVSLRSAGQGEPEQILLIGGIPLSNGMRI